MNRWLKFRGASAAQPDTYPRLLPPKLARRATTLLCLVPVRVWENMGNRLSRKKKRERNHVTDQDRAVLDLKNSRDRLKRYQKKVRNQSKDYTS